METFNEGRKLDEIKELKSDINAVWLKLGHFLGNDENVFPVKSNRQKQRIIQVIHFIRANGNPCVDLTDVPKKPFNNAEDLKIAKLRLRTFEADSCISAFKVLKNGIQVLKDINRFSKKPAKTLEYTLSKSSVVEFHKILCNFINNMERKCTILQTHVDFYPLYNKVSQWKDATLDEIQNNEVNATSSRTSVVSNINMLDSYIPYMQDFKLRNQTRLLIYRCRVLCDFIDCIEDKTISEAGIDLHEFCMVDSHIKHKKHSSPHHDKSASSDNGSIIGEKDDLVNTDTSIHRSNSKSAYNVLSMEGADQYYFSSTNTSRNNSYVPITPKSHNSRSMTNDHDVINEVAIVINEQQDLEQAPVFSPTELHTPPSYAYTNGHKKRPSKKIIQRKSSKNQHTIQMQKSVPKTPTEISEQLNLYTSSGTSTPTDLGLSDNEISQITIPEDIQIVEENNNNNNIKTPNEEFIDVKSLIHKFSPPVSTDTLIRNQKNKVHKRNLPKQSTPANIKVQSDNEIILTPVPTPKPRNRDSLAALPSTLPRAKKSCNENNNNQKSLPVFSPHPNKIPRPVPRIISGDKLNFNGKLDFNEDKETILPSKTVEKSSARKKQFDKPTTDESKLEENKSEEQKKEVDETKKNQFNETKNVKSGINAEVKKSTENDISTPEIKLPLSTTHIESNKSLEDTSATPRFQTTRDNKTRSDISQKIDSPKSPTQPISPITKIVDKDTIPVPLALEIKPPPSPQPPSPPTSPIPLPPQSSTVSPVFTDGIHETEDLVIDKTGSVSTTPSARTSISHPAFNTTFDIGFTLSDYDPPVVIDNGSGYCKAGFATDENPRVVCPTYIGRPKHQTQFTLANTHSDKCYIGSAANGKRGVLNLTYPIEHGVVTNWDDMEKLWQHVFENELRCEPDDHPVLLTEAALNPKQNKERMTQIMFEQFQVPAVYLAVQAVLALYGTGLTTGLVLDSGDGVTHVVPVYQGSALEYGVQRSEIAGRDLSDYFSKLLQQSGHSFVSSAEREIVKDIKEQLCYVAYDIEQEDKILGPKIEKSYTMPDGQEIMVEKERFLCPEPLFDPSILGKNQDDGIHNLIWRSVARCDADLKADLLSGIVLSGGTTMFPGMKKRLMKELQPIVSNLFKKKLKIHVPESPKTLVWRGGSVLANSTVTSWLSSFEYDEFGPSIIHRKGL